ncbi:peptide ABC transporter substrate-binding protein [Loktanella sp. 3ANDIMAR09]|uniref:peptide ABC transporter substrate-binding protein n=1 Tax=Loktanella sp. 3ANDIMAR09 TaxID=1225657 RepID=UPI0006FC078F|nr:peptide ABC transporter substrate-binding protein [Loktanella sp. 3ANDIMAR09]KQI67861.1 peptide ABC transporter substrate-binding protein [Loktanella sp. 3ANDIMAR09]
MTLTRRHLMASTAAVLVLTGTATLAESHIPADATLAAEQTFVYRVGDESPSIDPGKVEDTDGSDMVRQLFEGLYNQDADGNLIPGVATDYTVSDDNLTYTFTLRDNAKWSNGETVTAGDFEYAWKRAASPALASPYSWYIELMSIENASAVIAGEMEPDALGVTAVDDTTLQVTLSQPLPYFPQMLTHSTTFPVLQSNVEEFGDDWVQPGNMVSNGAYVLTEFVPQERAVMSRNTEYWDNANTTLETVTRLVVADENVGLTRYLAGELDRTDVPAGQYPRLSQEYPDQAMSVPLSCSYYYMFNLRDNGPEEFQDPAVRQALSLAVDRDIIVDAVLAGGQKPAYNFTHWATAGFEAPEIAMAGMTQEERNAQAQELLASAGYGADNPLTVDLVYNTNESHRAVAVAISQMWKQTLGVETTLANQEWQTFLDARGSGDFDVARGGWCADYNEASTFLDLMQSGSGYNDSKYVNEEVDALLANAKTSDNPNADYAAVEEIIATDMPIIPIYHYAAVKMLNDQIENWPVNNFQQNWYAKDLYKVAAE